MTTEVEQASETRTARQDPQGFAADRRRRAVNSMPPCNIVLLGKTGVGKSTLLNAAFGEDLAATGVGRPVTQHITEHRVDGLPIGLVDTRGIELKDEPETVRGEFDAEIDRRLRRPVQERLHVMWYCVSSEGSRFEPQEEPLVRALAERVPTIVVLTRAYDPADDDVLALRRHVESRTLPIEAIVPVLAAEKRIGPLRLPAHGVDELVRRTTGVVPEGVRRAFVNGQIVEVDSKLLAAFSRVDELAEQVDTAYKPLAFLRETVIGGASGADVLLARVLTVVGEVAAVFGDAAVPEETVRDLAVAAIGEGSGDEAIKELLQLASRLIMLIPPVGPSLAGRFGAKLVAALASAAASNHFDQAARKRAALLIRVIGRAMARTVADAARTEIAGEPLGREAIRERFSAYAEDEAVNASAT